MKQFLSNVRSLVMGRFRHGCNILGTLIFLLGFQAAAAFAELQILGVVTAVEAGDLLTLRLPDQSLRRVQIAGIDAPDPGQPYSQPAKEFVERKWIRRTVSVEQFESGATRDLVIGKVLDSQTSEDLGAAIVEAGFAWTNDLTDPEYRSKRDEARRARIGLWRDSIRQAPWDYRTARQNQEAHASMIRARIEARQEAVKKLTAGYKGMSSSRGRGWMGSVGGGGRGGGYRIGGCRR